LEPIVSALKHAEAGVTVVEPVRKAGISEQTFYEWKAKDVGLEVDQVQQMKNLRDENAQLK
jgi:putative transposase